MSKIKETSWCEDAYGNKSQQVFLFLCPGCECTHWFKMTGAGPCWEFNGSMEQPTVRASLLVRGQYVCHSFITDGKMQFLGDCTHTLTGQTVEIPDWED